MYANATGWNFGPHDERPDLLALRERQYAEFDRWLAAHDAQVRREAKAEALREAARLTRVLWTRTTNLPDLDDAEVGYSFDRWLEVYADRIEREGGEG